MNQPLKTPIKPSIVVNDIDFERLTQLATSSLGRFPEVAEELLVELDRAEIVPALEIADNVVRIGSLVTFEADGGAVRQVRLVYPAQADIAEGKVSILTPIGTALLGLSPGQSISWKARDGREHELRVTAVSAP